MPEDFESKRDEIHVALSAADSETERDALTGALLNLYQSLEEREFATA